MTGRIKAKWLSGFLAGWLGTAAVFGLAAAPGAGDAPRTAGAEHGLPAAHLQTAHLKFAGGKTITVDLAMTPQEQELGLMFRNSLPKDYGMLFVFPSQRKLQFWMKNTWVDLDMIFVDQGKKIIAIYQNVPRSYPETPEGSLARRDGEARYVLELPAGASDRYQLKKGQRLLFTVRDAQKKD
jgi:uncharacterized membrane protein (UPF0127 family)